MTWIMYTLAAAFLAAAVLAVYEWRKGQRVQFDDTHDAHRDPERAAYTKSEAIRAEAQIAHPPHGGGIF